MSTTPLDIAAPGARAGPPSMSAMMASTGSEDGRRPRNAAATRVAILTAASDRFLHASYDLVGLREIAADARVDPALISRYFGSKEDLFVAVIEELGDCSDLIDGSRDDFGVRAARQLLFTDDGSKLTWLSLMVHAASSPRAGEILRRTSAERFFQPLSDWIGGANAEPKAHLIASLLMGLVVTREATGRFGPEAERTEGFCLQVAAQLQAILDR